ncbi:MAG TPA: hypothetical protein VL371_04235 [Gemmataceae bacterium]|nr:hypothetical protein [Gemmataceae bacterium]
MQAAKATNGSMAAPAWPWRGLLAFALLGLVGMLGPDITPSSYIPELDHYVPRYVVLALSVGLAISAIRSRQRLDKLFGIAVVLVGGWMVAHIAMECIRILAR